MTTSTSRHAYADCFELFDQALDGKGLKVGFPTQGDAYQLRNRLHYARSLSRQEAMEVYADPKHPQFGVSPYDPLVVRIRHEEGDWWVYIEPRKVTGRVVELGAAE